MARLTVILPFYDETAYLRSALNSISAQPVADIQTIVVNDNPETFSPAAMRRLTDGHRVELIQQPRNLGLSAARNAGLDRARGGHVAFLDSDDYYTRGGLAAQLDRAEETGADITHAPTWFTRKGNPDLHLLPRDARLFARPRLAQGLLEAETAQFITSSWSSLYRRDFLTENALRFDPDQPRFEDRLFVLHTVTRARSIAFLGRPTRVWRGRGGSISVSATTPDTHRLQLQLLEKCLAHMRAEVASGRLPPRFAKRELFNTLSRLIWDMDLVDAIARDADPAYAGFAPRIPALLGDDCFGHAIFDDPVLRQISRVGMTTRRGRIGRAEFFAIHKALRTGDFAAAHARIAPPDPAPRRRPRSRRDRPRIILHLGLHKTGSTCIQHHLHHYRDRLAEQGILVPETGFGEGAALREGALTGHQGLAAALARGDDAPWTALRHEIRRSGAQTVVLSCENFSYPTLTERADRIAALAAHLDFATVTPVALARRPDRWIEAVYRETVVNGARGGGRGIGAFLVDHAPLMCDFPALLAPFETHFGTSLRLADFDAAKGDPWAAFCARAGLPGDLPARAVPRYDTPDRDTVLLLDLLNRLVADPARRQNILRAWFRLRPAPASEHSLLPPATRLRLLDNWAERSRDFAALRGYTPALDACRAALKTESWQPPRSLPVEMLDDLFDAAAIADAPPPRPAPRPSRSNVLCTIRLRPWVAGLLRLWRPGAG